MQIRVVRSDGTQETITVQPSARIVEGTHLNHFASVVDHYFDQDGYYDGFGMAVAPDAVSQELAQGLFSTPKPERIDQP